jgi:hypothetical protein
MNFCLVICSCIYILTCHSCKRQSYTDHDLTISLNHQLKSSNHKISFVNYKKGTWDRLYIIKPYFHEGLLDSTLKKYKKEIFDTGISTDEEISLLMLCQGDNLKSITIIHRPAYFTNEAMNLTPKGLSCWKPTEAHFNMKYEDKLYYISKPRDIRNVL